MGALANGFWSARARRGIAAAAVALAVGGLVLVRASRASPSRNAPGDAIGAIPIGVNSAHFAGPGAHGQVSLSHSKVPAGGGEAVFAEVRLSADVGEGVQERAPLSLVVVLDTSGSMQGDKISRAKEAVLGLMRDMRDDDEIAFVRYSSDADLLQPLARLGGVRDRLVAKVRSLEAGGGTNIPLGLSAGLRTLDQAFEAGEAGDPGSPGAPSQGRVRRVVLVSDGLDSSRLQAERLASDSAERGITVSSMGIGLDFDEAYMSSIARDGHGNFAFVNDGAALSAFLHRELDEASTTTVENAIVRLTLPQGVRFVRASGAATRVDRGAVVVKFGSLFAGDERRTLLELTTDLDAGEARTISAEAEWHRVGGRDADVQATPALKLLATRDAGEVLMGKDRTVLANATSVLSSQRELEAADAYAHGDRDKAQHLIQQNVAALSAAAASAPAPVAARLAKQSDEYKAQMGSFSVAPSSDDGKRAAKAAVAKDSRNIDRAAY
jgi:Ca-activated chloride channel homolog